MEVAIDRPTAHDCISAPAVALIEICGQMLRYQMWMDIHFAKCAVWSVWSAVMFVICNKKAKNKTNMT